MLIILMRLPWIPKRVRLLDRQASAAGQIFAPAKSAFMPSMAI
ncbi:hypothetical protein [Methylotuvimicrobium buryatense]|nr:hypothetical protein [Methylotuvimicrobium buryatense]